jgi:hypothetical protein
VFLEETTTTMEMPNFEGFFEIFEQISGFLMLIESFAAGLMNLFGWASSNIGYFILAIILSVCGNWLLTAFFMWVGFILLKKTENFGKIFVTSIENFLLGLLVILIPIIGLILFPIVQTININRRHETSGWGSFLVWLIAYLSTGAIIVLIFITAGGLTLIQEFFGSLM